MTDDERQERKDELLYLASTGVRFGIKFYTIGVVILGVVFVGFTVAFLAAVLLASSR